MTYYANRCIFRGFGGHVHSITRVRTTRLDSQSCGNAAVTTSTARRGDSHPTYADELGYQDPTDDTAVRI